MNNSLIEQAKRGLLPDALGLNDIATLLFHHRSGKTGLDKLKAAEAASNFSIWVNTQLKVKRYPVEGFTGKQISTVCGLIGKEPLLHKDTVKAMLTTLDLWPLEKNEHESLLNFWWNMKPIKKLNVMQKRDKSAKTWLAKNPDWKEMTKDQIHKNLKEFDQENWAKSFETFNRWWKKQKVFPK